MENNKEIIHESEVKELIIELRGEKVLIDRDEMCIRDRYNAVRDSLSVPLPDG